MITSWALCTPLIPLVCLPVAMAVIYFDAWTEASDIMLHCPVFTFALS